jgi:hypothetical protein
MSSSTLAALAATATPALALAPAPALAPTPALTPTLALPPLPPPQLALPALPAHLTCAIVVLSLLVACYMPVLRPSRITNLA